MATLGQELRAERERRTLSIKDVSDRTKISTRFISALEDDRWDELPQKFFLKGVIKAYAQAIGADPALFLAKYKEQQRIRSESSDEHNDSPRQKEHEAPGKKRKRPVVLPVALVLFLLIAAAAGYWIFLKPERGPRPQIPSTRAPDPPPISSAPAVIAPEEQKAEPAETGLRLEFRFNADSWMHVAADGVVILNGIKPAGSTASLRAEREFIIQTGNAGGFDFTLNGRPGRPLGGSGVVLTDIRINSENAGTFLREENPPAAEAAGR